MSRSGGAPAGDRGARGTTGTTCLGRRKQDTAASQAAVGIVAIEAGIDPHILPAPLRTADLRQFRLDDLDRIREWEGLEGIPVAIVVAHATHVQANEVSVRITRAGGEPTGIHRFGGRS